jgi:hypothetical protein
MKISHLENKEFIIPSYETRQTLHIMGPPGGGKSDVARNVFPEVLSKHYGEDFGVVIIDMPSIDAVDFRGFCIPTKDAEGNATSIFTRSGLMPTKQYLDAHPRGIIVLEEKNAADNLTNKAANMVTLERRFGDYKLPEGWWVVALSNRQADKSGAGKPMMHSINRECIVELDFNMEDYTSYWERTGMHPYGVAFAKQQAGAFAVEVPKEARPFCTPRSYTFAWNWLTAASGGDINNIQTGVIPQETIAGYIGEGAAANMFSFLSVKDELPTIEEIIASPKQAKLPSDGRLDAVYMVMQNCVHHVDADNVSQLWDYVERLPKEIQTSAAVAFINKTNGTLLNAPALGDWIAKNRALVAATLR